MKEIKPSGLRCIPPLRCSQRGENSNWQKKRSRKNKNKKIGGDIRLYKFSFGNINMKQFNGIERQLIKNFHHPEKRILDKKILLKLLNHESSRKLKARYLPQ